MALKTNEELLLERIVKAVEEIAANTDNARHLLKDIRQMIYSSEAKIEAILTPIKPQDVGMSAKGEKQCPRFHE